MTSEEGKGSVSMAMAEEKASDEYFCFNRGQGRGSGFDKAVRTLHSGAGWHNGCGKDA